MEDPENPATLEDIADAKLQIKKDEKEKLKLKKELAEVSEKIVKDKELEAARVVEAAEAEAAETAEK